MKSPRGWVHVRPFGALSWTSRLDASILEALKLLAIAARPQPVNDERNAALPGTNCIIAEVK